MKKSTTPGSRGKKVGFDRSEAVKPEPTQSQQPISVLNYYIQQQYAKTLVK